MRRRTRGRSKRAGRPRQGALAFPNGWGGWREGAGRKPSGVHVGPRGEARAGVSHKRKAAHDRRYPVHVTLRLRAGLPSLRRKGEYAVLLGAFESGRERFGFRLIHFAVLGNHVHLMTEAEDRRAHSRGTQGLAIRIAKRLNKLWNRRGKVFADRFHGRELGTPREVRNALNYLMHNARKHGLRIAPTGPDPYSSGRWFDGWRDLARDRVWPAPLAAARSWLLRKGWRRWGLIQVGLAGPP